MRVVKGSGKAVNYLTPPRILLALVTAWVRRGRWFDEEVAASLYYTPPFCIMCLIAQTREAPNIISIVHHTYSPIKYGNRSGAHDDNFVKWRNYLLSFIPAKAIFAKIVIAKYWGLLIIEYNEIECHHLIIQIMSVR
jgi:hypothetical protein